MSWAVFLGSQSGGGRLREGAHVRARAGEGRADAQQGVVVAAADQVGGVQALITKVDGVSRLTQVNLNQVRSDFLNHLLLNESENLEFS